MSVRVKQGMMDMGVPIVGAPALWPAPKYFTQATAMPRYTHQCRGGIRMMSASGGTPADLLTNEARGIALAHFEHVEKQVALATTTAALIVTATALLLNAYLMIANNYHVFSTLRPAWERAIFFGGGVALVIGAMLSLFAVFPNLSSRWFRASDTRSLLFFGTIGKMQPNQHITEFSRASRDQMDIEIVSQTRTKSEWLIRMFRLIQGGIFFVTVGAILGLFVLSYDAAMSAGHSVPT
jgi:Family of unknown function (DUF5706)